MACSACYYLVISSTHLSNGHFRRVKGVFRGPLCPTTASDSPERAERALSCSVEDLKALFYCELCHKQYLRHQEFDNHINSYDHAHKQRLKELKHREFARNVASKSWKDQRKQEKALRRLHQLAQLQQNTQRVPGLRSAVRAVSQQHNRDMDQRDVKSGSFNPAPRSPPMQLVTVPLSQLPDDPYQSPSQTPLATALAESPRVTNPASSRRPAAVNPQSCLGLYPLLPLPGQGRAGGRLGVSFCFSRRGPRLEPSASVFADVEEEGREKRDQMKERIKGMMEDRDREIEDVEEGKHSESEKLDSDSVELDDLAPVPRKAARDQEEIAKRDTVKEHSPISSLVADNQSHDSLPFGSLDSKTQVAIWGTALAHMDTRYTDGRPVRKQESEGIREEGQCMRVLGKDDSTSLTWPVSLLKFTRSQPHICYSCNPLRTNPHQAEELTEDLRESQRNQSCAPSGEHIPRVPAILTPDAHSCSQGQTTQEPGAHTRETADFKAEQRIDAETEEHLLLKTKSLSSPGTRRERATYERTASHPFDPAHSDSSDTDSQNPRASRLRGARGIREGAIMALGCKSEAVIHCGTQGISASRCGCGRETACECARTPQTSVGVPEVSRKRREAGAKKRKLGKGERGEKEKASKRRQSAGRKVRSVVSTVSTGRERKGDVGGSWGRKERQREAGVRRRRRRRRAQRAGSSWLLGRSEAEPVSVSVRKRRTHRGHGTGSPSPAEPCSVFSQLSRHTADGDAEGEGRRDRHAATYPWRSHLSLRSLSPGCNSKLFWERGHRGNPRSLFDCRYPDDSCGCSPSRRRKLLHWDKKCIHDKGQSLRHREAWEETERGRKMGGHSGCLNSETEWRGESCPRRRRSRSRAVEWDRLTRCSPSPRRWGRRERHFSTEDVDWDGCSVDRWTWGSSDSGEDRGTRRSTSGPRTGPDGRCSPGSVWKHTPEIRRPSSKRSSSSEWWTSRRTCSPDVNTRAGRCHSPRSCSPCSSTGVSELSWESSKSCSCSGVTVEGLTGSSCRTSSGAPELKIQAPQEAKKQSGPTSSPSGLNCSSLSHSSSDRSSFSPRVPLVSTEENDSPSDLGHGPPEEVTANMSGTTPGLSSSNKSGSQKPPRTLLLPLIGKLPAIQRRARRIKGLLEKRRDKEGEDEEAAKRGGADAGGASESRTAPPQITTDKKQTGGEAAPPLSFTAEEMDKYRLLREQAREHMQKVLEQTQESVDADKETGYTHAARVDNRVTSEERYAPARLHSASRAQTPSLHTDSRQTQAQHTLQVALPPPHVTQQGRFTRPVALGVASLPPLPPSPPHSSLRHIFLQHAALSVPPCSSSSSATPPSAAIHPHPAPLRHPVGPLHPSLAHHLHLSTFSVSSLFPSILLSHHPIHLLPQAPAFHATPLAPLSPVALRPLNPQPFMDRAWPVRFQQEAL